MARWKQELDISDIHDDFKNGVITVNQLAGCVADRIRRDLGVDELGNRRLSEIAEEFDGVAGDPNATADDYDYALESLYNWADLGHRCWVNTVSFGKGAK